MSLTLRWVDEADYGRVAQTRLQCYAASAGGLDRALDYLRTDSRVQPGDCLLAEDTGRAVGTATAHSMRMWVRGGAVPCQGVAFVGTAPTHRRTATAGGAGVATRIMNETLRRARERSEVISALMPFRGSFYEHFGYGIVERRADWTVPISIFPHGSAERLRYFEPADLPALAQCRQEIAEAGQADIERSIGHWQRLLGGEDFCVIDRPDDAGPVNGWLLFHRQHLPDFRDVLRVPEIAYRNVPALKRLLYFLGSLRDQYSQAVLTLPADLPLNRLLREVQMTHRDSRNHPTAECRPYTRMQVRVLDHVRLLEAMRLGPSLCGKATVQVAETEGNESRLALDFTDGRITAKTAAQSADFTCSDRTWAAVVLGDLPASRAVELGLAQAANPHALALLDQFAAGPAPFTLEYF